MSDLLTQLPGYLLRRAANNMMADLRARLAPTGLTVAEASLLIIVGERQDMTSAEIGKTLEIRRANMVPLLKRLEGEGLISRVPLDLKSNAIILTEAGQEKSKDAEEIIGEFEQDLLERVAAPHRSHLLPVLKALC